MQLQIWKLIDHYRSYLPEDDSKRPDVGLGRVSEVPKNLRRSPLDPDWFLCLGDKLVVDYGTSSGEVSQLNDEVAPDVEATG